MAGWGYFMLAHACAGCRASLNVPRTHFAVISQSFTSFSQKCLYKQIYKVQDSGEEKKYMFSGAEFYGRTAGLGSMAGGQMFC